MFSRFIQPNETTVSYSAVRVWFYRSPAEIHVEYGAGGDNAPSDPGTACPQTAACTHASKYW